MLLFGYPQVAGYKHLSLMKALTGFEMTVDALLIDRVNLSLIKICLDTKRERTFGIHAVDN